MNKARGFKIRELSLFLPAYNEEKNIKRTVAQAIKVLEKIAKDWQIIVVNDGSTDKTGGVVKSLIKKEPRISMITHTPNRGYGAALKTGLSHCQYPWIVYTDADGQFDLEEIENFLARKDGADLIIGYRVRRRDSVARLLIAKLLQIWNFLFFGLWLRDADCGFKLIKKEVVDKVGNLRTESAITETEFLVRAKRAGFKIIELPVHHSPRQAGCQTGADPEVVFKAIKESFTLWRELKKG